MLTLCCFAALIGWMRLTQLPVDMGPEDGFNHTRWKARIFRVVGNSLME